LDPLKRGSSHADTRQARDGLGLGLFIVSEVVRAHGGEVEVRSHGDETTFCVHLPGRQADRAS